MTDVRNITFAEAFTDPDFTALITEYSEESALAGLPKPNCDPAIYRQLENAGLLHVLGAYDGMRMIGFLNLLVSTIPHYNTRVATAESYFIGFKDRPTGGGLMLLRAAEEYAKGLGAVGFLVSAPVGSRLEEFLPKTGYAETNKIFFRSLQ